MYRRRIEKVRTKVLLFILYQHLHMKTEAAYDFIIRTWRICQHSAVLQTAAFCVDFVFTQCVWQKGEASKTLHLATFKSLHRQQFNLCPALCQPLTRLSIISVLPSLTSLPLKSSHSRTPLHLKQVSTHTRTASRLLTPGWFWIHDTEASLAEYQSAASLSM